MTLFAIIYANITFMGSSHSQIIGFKMFTELLISKIISVKACNMADDKDKKLYWPLESALIFNAKDSSSESLFTTSILFS